MENNYNEIASELRSKIKSIIMLYETEKEKNRVLNKQNLQLVEKVNSLEQKTNDLELKYNNLKLGKAIASGDESKHDAKIKINKIVREIDKCIALLNN
ncbi:MAG: hypothetical protein JXJ22_00145 [Bacteroidales bacterium]|nr:hypothetical protein [Bacteroidales bacterium]